jgi:predicted MPP superfamily phosphohydrolase
MHLKNGAWTGHPATCGGADGAYAPWGSWYRRNASGPRRALFRIVQELREGGSGLKAWPVLGIVVVQTILFLAHWFIYFTWIDFWGGLGVWATLALRTALFLLAFSFMAAALFGFYFANRLVTVLYRLAAVWLGLLNFFFLAACLCWLARLALGLAGLAVDRPLLGAVFYSLALVASLYGLVNARIIRIRRIRVHLDGLPASWRGRTALVVSDLHLGHVNGAGFSRRIVELAARLNPQIIFLPGDLFDGSKADAALLAEPFRALSPPFGSYFATGNHDEFGNAAHYGEVLTRVGIRVLSNEKVTVDGLEIVGISNRDAGYPIRLRALLESLGLGPGLVPDRASILLNHVPNRLPIVEQAGIKLQLSGHTHGGQIFPFTWLTRRAFGKFTYGLQRFGALQVFTSSGAGTWGPPMRVGTSSEVVLLSFE